MFQNGSQGDDRVSGGESRVYTSLFFANQATEVFLNMGQDASR